MGRKTVVREAWLHVRCIFQIAITAIPKGDVEGSIALELPLCVIYRVVRADLDPHALSNAVDTRPLLGVAPMPQVY